MSLVRVESAGFRWICLHHCWREILWKSITTTIAKTSVFWLQIFADVCCLTWGLVISVISVVGGCAEKITSLGSMPAQPDLIYPFLVTLYINKSWNMILYSIWGIQANLTKWPYISGWWINFYCLLINFQNLCSDLHSIEALENAKAADGLWPEVWVTGLPLKAAGESILKDKFPTQIWW